MPGTSGSGAKIQAYTMRAQLIHDAALTQNTYYDVLNGGATVANAAAGTALTNVRVHSISFEQKTAAEDLEVIITDDDGEHIVARAGAVANTPYLIVFNSYDPDGAGKFASVGTFTYPAFLFETRTLKLSYRKTTANGANNTECKIIYAQMV